MRPALWLIAVLPLAAQPKLLTNAKVDTRSAAAGLDREFRSLVTAQPQPAWIAYQVPTVRGNNLKKIRITSSSLSKKFAGWRQISGTVEANV